MLQRLQEYIIENNLADISHRLLVAVSGGVDSVVLCELLFQAGYSFSIAHCNFQLRGAESDLDMEFVKNLAKKYQCQYFIKKFETEAEAKTKKISIQMAARNLRYAWFDELMRDQGFDLTAVAHHEGDVLETVLLNITRGTGIAGLHGISNKNGRIIRPMLFASKSEIIEYAKQHALFWREDSSNNTIKYSRNLIRHKVIPLLTEINPSINSVTAETVHKIKEVEAFFLAEVEKVREKYYKNHGNKITVNLGFLYEPGDMALLYELIKNLGYSWKECVQIKNSIHSNHIGNRFYAGIYELVADRNQLIITPRSREHFSLQEIALETQTFQNSIFSLSIEKFVVSDFQTYSEPNVAVFDHEKLTFPLQVRPWMNGDKIKPLGMKGSKKVSDLLIDLKIPLNLKSKVFVLLSGDEIIWVIGHRMSEKYKVGGDTQVVYKVMVHY